MVALSSIAKPHYLHAGALYLPEHLGSVFPDINKCASLEEVGIWLEHLSHVQKKEVPRLLSEAAAIVFVSGQHPLTYQPCFAYFSCSLKQALQLSRRSLPNEIPFGEIYRTLLSADAEQPGPLRLFINARYHFDERKLNICIQ
jgi:hypothetical protein